MTFNQKPDHNNSVLPPYPQGHDFYGPFVEETLTDGWCYGSITEFIDSDRDEGCVSGDGFVVAPDGCYCGLVWSVDFPEPFEILRGPSREKCWAVLEVKFLKTVYSVQDLVDNFHSILPLLIEMHTEFHDRSFARANSP